MENEYIYESARRAFISIQVAKLLYDFGRKDILEHIGGYFVDEDSEYEVTLTALDHVSDYTNCIYRENSELTHYYFMDGAMTEYYRLSRTYGEIKGIAWANNPYRQKADEHIDEWLGAPNCYYCDYKLFNRSHHYWGCVLKFTYDSSYFNEHFPLLERLLNVFDFFRNEASRLRFEVWKLEQTESKVLLLPPPKETRRAA